jgi:hypothetical protein
MDTSNRLMQSINKIEIININELSKRKNEDVNLCDLL